MFPWQQSKLGLGFLVGLSAGFLLGIGILIGVLWGTSWSENRLTLPALPETALHASASDSGETMAVATGAIDDDVEGVYFLDFLTGELQCAVINFRTGKFAGLFRTNVLADLAVKSKNPKFLMVTGMVNFRRGSGAARPALSVVYVVDATTGRYGAYGVQWRREFAAIARPQAGPITLLDIGSARTVAIRE